MNELTQNELETMERVMSSGEGWLNKYNAIKNTPSLEEKGFVKTGRAYWEWTEEGLALYRQAIKIKLMYLTDEQAGFLSGLMEGSPHNLLPLCDCDHCKIASALYRLRYIKTKDDYCHLTEEGLKALKLWEESKEVPINLELAERIYETGYYDFLPFFHDPDKRTVDRKQHVSDIIKTWKEEQQYKENLLRDNPDWNYEDVTVTKSDDAKYIIAVDFDREG